MTFQGRSKGLFIDFTPEGKNMTRQVQLRSYVTNFEKMYVLVKYQATCFELQSRLFSQSQTHKITVTARQTCQKLRLTGVKKSMVSQ